MRILGRLPFPNPGLWQFRAFNLFDAMTRRIHDRLPFLNPWQWKITGVYLFSNPGPANISGVYLSKPMTMKTRLRLPFLNTWQWAFSGAYHAQDLPSRNLVCPAHIFTIFLHEWRATLPAPNFTVFTWMTPTKKLLLKTLPAHNFTASVSGRRA